MWLMMSVQARKDITAARSRSLYYCWGKILTQLDGFPVLELRLLLPIVQLSVE